MIPISYCSSKEEGEGWEVSEQRSEKPLTASDLWNHRDICDCSSPGMEETACSSLPGLPKRISNLCSRLIWTPQGSHAFLPYKLGWYWKQLITFPCYVWYSPLFYSINFDKLNLDNWLIRYHKLYISNCYWVYAKQKDTTPWKSEKPKEFTAPSLTWLFF